MVSRHTTGMMPCQYHILIPHRDGVEGETTLEFIHNELIDLLSSVDDQVHIELISSPKSQTERKCVSVIFENNWGCQIFFNDDKATIVNDSQHWSQTHGINFPISIQHNLARYCRRLDISCDPDPENDYFRDFDSLLLHLENNLATREQVCHTFDSVNNRFLPHDLDVDHASQL